MTTSPPSSPSPPPPPPDKRYKVVCLGESSAGKTSFTLRFVKKEFVDSVEPTIGAGFMVGRIANTTFELWDTAGSERYRSLAPMYYRNSRGAIVAYDLTSQDSFDKVGYWVQELKATGLNIVICLVGAKLDLASAGDGGGGGHRVVQEQQGREFAEANGLGFFETSAKTGENVDDVFAWLDREVRRIDALAPPPAAAAASASAQQQQQQREVRLQEQQQAERGGLCC